MAGATREDPIAITAFPFSYTVPAGYTANDVYFSLPSGVSAPGSWLVADTTDSTVAGDTGFSSAYLAAGTTWIPNVDQPPYAGSGLRRVAVLSADPLSAIFIIGVHATGALPVGLSVDFYLEALKDVSGVVLDATGAPAARSVALIKRDPTDPLNMYVVASAESDPTTGEYVLSGGVWNGEYIALALDNAGRNDVVARFEVTDSLDDPYI